MRRRLGSWFLELRWRPKDGVVCSGLFMTPRLFATWMVGGGLPIFWRHFHPLRSWRWYTQQDGEGYRRTSFAVYSLHGSYETAPRRLKRPIPPTATEWGAL